MINSTKYGQMSVKLRFDSPSDGGPVSRTRSFTGLGSLTGRRRSSSVRNSLRSKSGSGTTSPRTHLSPVRGAESCGPRSRSREYLEGHQVEMDFLSSQQRETKRNSRLAFLYDLEKEIRALERYIRRLEFQISKVEELYETYCIQWRLCQGAVNMRRAFSLSPPPGRPARDMSSMEGELEILLGELHIKMKGLIGFARLCPGDQYEVVVRLGRQRWRIRGRIESDDTQTWDQEEMAFLPHLNHNFHVKVTEAKGLGWQLVGSVTCASADFFVSKPRLMLVDITELGTIKLQLEVSWNPFDSSDKMKPVSISRQSVSSRKSSVYSWTTPNTPSFTEKYFMSMVRELQDTEGSLPSLLPKSRPPRGGVSLLSYLSHQSQVSISSSHSPHSSSTPICSTPDILKKSTVGETDPVISQNDLSLLRSSCSEETLAVEEVLGSFDFLSNDLNADDDSASCLGSIRLKDSGISSFKENTLRSLGLLSQDSHSASQEELEVAPLTCGNWSLDQALETHLDICCSLLQVLRVSDSAPSRQDLLDEVSLQTEVLDKINSLLLQKNDNISAKDIFPKAQKTRDLLQFWEDCTDDVMSAPFCCHADSFSRSLRKRYTHKVKAKQPGQSERVFALLVQQVASVCRTVPIPSTSTSSTSTSSSPQRLTVFQLSVYMKRWSISDLGEHISQLAKEEYVLWSLRGPKRRKALNKLKHRHLGELLPLRQTLHTLSSLQTDSHHKVCKAAANCLSRAANRKSFRTKAVVYFTESLKSWDPQVQQCSCLALKRLRAAESVDHIAELWRSDNEDVRSAARETVLSFGKKGHAAFQKMDQIDSELQEEAYKNLETEITIL
ncbi:hypothetical protein WMY93_012079 [Mugilogobius chulae]|uniref:FAM65 N-terminal domain-containing protein n=1 Tax=Mugilogobius chulae TaxID=88201 RepID=A0AAW0P4F9_9GOBI